jgi:hypothetical protein
MNKRYGQIAAVLLALGALAIMAEPILAQKAFLVRVRKHYALDKSNGNCKLCHEPKTNEEPGKGNLNKFGLAIQKDPDMKPLLGKDDEYKFSEAELDIFEKVVVKHESEDSDGDGATNKEELELGTFPGDAKSLPEKPKLEKYRKDKAAKPDKK